jgi:UDP-2,4-diacetamido-2,4,6-trideoxy-beta-L-altropyranose hydrolase
MKILFRVDSSSSIGLGHVMRCLVLAKEFENTQVHFAAQELDGNINHQIPYPLHVLSSNKPEEIIKLILSLHVKMLVIDHYGISYETEKYIKEKTGVKIYVIDDNYKRHFCDILRNPNIYANPEKYKGLVPAHCELECAKPLIREEFHLEKSKKREKIYDIFLSLGGADVANLTLPILHSLPQSLHVSIVTTSANAILDKITSYAKNKPKISLHVNSSEVAKILNQSRFAIITPSTLAHEVLYMNIPFLAIKVASNQDDMYGYLKAQNYEVMSEWKEEGLKQCLKRNYNLFH